MKFKWLSAACWLITTNEGVRIITDPFFQSFVPEGAPPAGGYPPERRGIDEYADIIAMTHGHFDHSYVYRVKGVPQLYTGGAPAEIKGVRFTGVNAFHDNYGDGDRGNVSCIGMETDGLRVRHMGDYGQKALADEQLEQIGRVDILMTPWGDWTPALLDQLKPRVVFPMHHARVDFFMRSLKGFSQPDTSEVEISAGTLPAEMKCLMLKEFISQ